MRRSVGTAMLWGAFGVTLFGIFLTPVFYYVVRWLFDRRQLRAARAPGQGTERNGTVLIDPRGPAPDALHLRNGKVETRYEAIAVRAGLNGRGD
jgi:hypothetical protein